MDRSAMTELNRLFIYFARRHRCIPTDFCYCVSRRVFEQLKDDLKILCLYRKQPFYTATIRGRAAVFIAGIPVISR